MSAIAIGFDQDGFLVEGTHVLSRQQFLELFCSTGVPERSDGLPRHHFHKPFQDICEWAEEAGATSLVVGGSFVTKKVCPSDLDLLIFFATSSEVPKSLESFYVDGVSLDIQLLSEDQQEIKAAFLELLSTTRQNVRHGIVQVKFNTRVLTHSAPGERSAAFDIVKTAYLGRKYARLNHIKGMVVPIHGIRTHAEWIPKVSLCASTSGWAVAPYYYGYQGVGILVDEEQKQKVVEGLRDWLLEIRSVWEGPVSIIAHSFGTYVVARYLRDAGDLLIDIDSIIFSGAIVRRDYDWAVHFKTNKIGEILNTISSEDEWVRFMPEGGLPLAGKDTLFGKGGYLGFTAEHPRLRQIRSSLLGHNNIFKFDVIRGQWIPFLELCRGSAYRAAQDALIASLREELTLQRASRSPE